MCAGFLGGRLLCSGAQWRVIGDRPRADLAFTAGSGGLVPGSGGSMAGFSPPVSAWGVIHAVVARASGRLPICTALALTVPRRLLVGLSRFSRDCAMRRGNAFYDGSCRHQQERVALDRAAAVLVVGWSRELEVTCGAAAGTADGPWPLPCTGLRCHGKNFVPPRPMTTTPSGAVFFFRSVHRSVISPLRGVSSLGENLNLLVR